MFIDREKDSLHLVLIAKINILKHLYSRSISSACLTENSVTQHHPKTCGGVSYFFFFFFVCMEVNIDDFSITDYWV